MSKIKWFLSRTAPEWMVAALVLLLTLFFQQILRAPIQWPAASQLQSVGSDFLLPFAIVSIWIIMPLPIFRQKGTWRQVVTRLVQQTTDALCFGLVIILCFHIKLWAPLLHPVSYDPIFEAIDRTCFFWLDPLIAWRSHWPQIDWINHLYFVFFVWMFFISFVVHNLRGRCEFRRVFLASLLVQAFGSMLYLIAPAVGPFMYHPSANAWMGELERYFYDVHLNLLAGGANWLQGNTGLHLTQGLAAFPSLHAAAAFVFLYYSWRYCRWLTVLYGPFFAWILFEAMATRWHYGIDLVAGIALACGSIGVADLWMRTHEKAGCKVLPQADAFLPAPGVCPEKNIAAVRSEG